jgi:type IV pilus assembly protein PilM
VDFGAHSIKMLQLMPRGDQFEVIAAARQALPSDMPAAGDMRQQVLGQLIAKMVSSGGFVGKTAVACLPATAIQFKNLRFPKMPADELTAAVAWEAGDRLKLPPDEVRIQYFDAGEVRQGDETRQEIILMAASIAAIDDHAASLTVAGLRPACVECVPGALVRALATKATDDDPDPVRVIVDIGYASTKVVIARRGRVVFFKNIEIGGRTLDAAVAQRLGLDPLEAAQLRRKFETATGVATESVKPLFGDTQRDTIERAVDEAMRTTLADLGKELSLCLRYYSVTFRGRRPDELLLTGGESTDPRLARLLADAVGVTVGPVRLHERIDTTAAGHLLGCPSRLTEWSVAAGLAMWRPSRVMKRGAA